MSPTYELPPGFAREFARMPREQRRAFQVAVEKLVEAMAFSMKRNGFEADGGKRCRAGT